MDSPAKFFIPNKHLKEEFVSNLSGSSKLEIFSIILAFPLLVVLRRAILPKYASGSNTWKRSAKKTDNGDDAVPPNSVAYMGTILLDFTSAVIPVILFLTVLADWIHLAAVSLVFLVSLCILTKRFSSPNSVDLQSHSTLRSWISSYRIVMMVLTCLCILAVDFNIYPRRYAKTETYGTGLMDVGVGSFVLANALVSRQARNASSGHKRWKAAFQSTLPLILLGLGRIISTRGVDYQVHVGEYGVHWNFFFTLAGVSILTSIINIHPRYCGFLGFLILAGYQFCLMRGLNVYLLSNEREATIISQNKEGIFSMFGYWGMYLIGVYMGHLLFFRTSSTVLTRRNPRKLVEVWIVSLLFWLSTLVFEKYVEGISRRMCNMGYVTFVFALNFQILGILMLSDYMPGKTGSELALLEEAVSPNLLPYFLLGNILTGLVNLSMDTLSASPFQSTVILVTYEFILSFSFALAHFYGITLKFCL